MQGARRGALEEAGVRDLCNRVSTPQTPGLVPCLVLSTQRDWRPWSRGAGCRHAPGGAPGRRHLTPGLAEKGGPRPEGQVSGGWERMMGRGAEGPPEPNLGRSEEMLPVGLQTCRVQGANNSRPIPRPRGRQGSLRGCTPTPSCRPLLGPSVSRAQRASWHWDHSA